MNSPVCVAILLFLSFSLAPASTSTAIAACDQDDAPDCACFNDNGDWDAGGPVNSGIIQDVALDTLGTVESCSTGISGDRYEKDTGKPYYSILLGYNNVSNALGAAELMAAGVNCFEDRQAWCSEAISYWHREAGIPYALGYRNPDGHPNWLIKSVPDMRSWYEGEASGGRGRWIQAEELDYNDFRPGENFPLPGSYMAWTGCVINVNTMEVDYYGFAVSHSLMINEMTVHRDGNGRVFKVEATFIEGNSNNRVKTREWDDLITFTPQGSQWIGWDKGPDKISGTIDDIGIKIYGFGVDLDAAGNPIYDANRLHFQDHQVVRRAVLRFQVPEDDEWDEIYAKRIPALKILSSKLRENKGPSITCSSDAVKCGRLPDGGEVSWSFPKGIEKDVTIEVDFLAPNPLPLKGVQMFWEPGCVPEKFKVQLGDEQKKFYDTSLTDFSKIKASMDMDAIPMMARLARPLTGLRYVKFVFPNEAFQYCGAVMKDLLIPYDEQGRQDADEIPEDLPVFVDIKPGFCPNVLIPGGTGKVQVALLGSTTVPVDSIDTSTLRYNGKSVKPLSTEQKDVAEPFIGTAPGCHSLGADGHTDLVLTFDEAELTKAVGIDKSSTERYFAVKVTGQMSKKYGNAPFLGQDFVKSPAPVPLILLLEGK